jgi:hypothetical protein
MLHKVFLSIGAMKTGTTWLYERLKNHPEIHFSMEKELHYFADKYGVAKPLSLSRRKRTTEEALKNLFNSCPAGVDINTAIRWYVDYIADPVDDIWFEHLIGAEAFSDRYVADFSNLTCHLRSSDWADLHGKTGLLKVIYILREPVPRVWSHYKYHLEYARHPLALRPTERFLQFKRLISNDWFIRNSHYSKVISTLQGALLPHEYRIYYFEDMITEPLAFLRNVEDFLGICSFDYDPKTLFRKERASIEATMPPEWNQYAAKLLEGETAWLKDHGYWHTAWK